MIDELRAAIAERDWPRALRRAVNAWRAQRDPALADLADAIAARAGKLPAAPKGKAHALWWRGLAVPYHIDRVAAAIAHADERLKGTDVLWPDLVERYADLEEEPGGRFVADFARECAFGYRAATHTNALERLAALASWPDDPRAAPLLARWLVEAPVRWDPLEHKRATAVFYGTIAARLAMLADARVVPVLEPCIARPRGPTAAIRTLQRELAVKVLAATTRRERDPANVALLAEVATPARGDAAGRPVDEAELWRQCAMQRDTIAPRLVLADLLVERGDPRGEVIALMCDGGAKAMSRAHKLLRTHWKTFLGDLALVLNRNGTEFRHGMLEVARVGVPATPGWAFTRVHGNRELATVHTIRTGDVAPADFAAFLDGVPRPERISIDAPEIIDELRKVRARWPLTALEYGHYSVRAPYRYAFPALVDTFDHVAELMPELEEVRFHRMQWPHDVGQQLVALVPQLQRRLPRLQRIVFDDEVHRLPAELRAAALVQIVERER
jgi:uncharacterized protein (TIGR02996 family)